MKSEDGMNWDTVELLNDKNTEIEGLKEQNIHLQKQLDLERHYNRIMRSALEKYANKRNWSYNFVRHLAIWGESREDRKDGPYIAQEVLNEIDKIK